MSILNLLKEKTADEKVQIRYLYKNMILSEQKQEGVNIME